LRVGLRGGGVRGASGRRHQAGPRASDGAAGTRRSADAAERGRRVEIACPDRPREALCPQSAREKAATRLFAAARPAGSATRSRSSGGRSGRDLRGLPLMFASPHRRRCLPDASLPSSDESAGANARLLRAAPALCATTLTNMRRVYSHHVCHGVMVQRHKPTVGCRTRETGRSAPHSPLSARSACFRPWRRA